MTKKIIAIIGATGDIGSAIAKSLAKGNYRLLLFAEDKKRLNSLAEEIKTTTPSADIDCMGCAADASWEADIIIPAVPACSQKEIAEKIKPYANRKTVISIPDSLNETKNNLIISKTTDAAEELQKLLPGSKVVRASNISFVADFFQPAGEDRQNDAFIDGDEEDVLQTISEILKAAELHPAQLINHKTK